MLIGKSLPRRCDRCISVPVEVDSRDRDLNHASPPLSASLSSRGHPASTDELVRFRWGLPLRLPLRSISTTPPPADFNGEWDSRKILISPLLSISQLTSSLSINFLYGGIQFLEEPITFFRHVFSQQAPQDGFDETVIFLSCPFPSLWFFFFFFWFFSDFFVFFLCKMMSHYKVKMIMMGCRSFM